jgi:hypothetical protein
VVGIGSIDQRRLETEWREVLRDQGSETVYAFRVPGEAIDLHHAAQEIERIRQATLAEGSQRLAVHQSTSGRKSNRGRYIA